MDGLRGLMDKASDFGSEDCGFESRRSRGFRPHMLSVHWPAQHVHPLISGQHIPLSIHPVITSTHSPDTHITTEFSHTDSATQTVIVSVGENQSTSTGTQALLYCICTCPHSDDSDCDISHHSWLLVASEEWIGRLSRLV